MKVKDFLELLRFPIRIEIRNEDNINICYTSSDLEGIKPYLEREIAEWFPSVASAPMRWDVCILLKDEAEKKDEQN